MSQAFIIFRLERNGKGILYRKYLTPAFTWSKKQSSAYLADFITMKLLAEKLKLEFPDLIIERRGEGAG